jgi:hypothetical protein
MTGHALVVRWRTTTTAVRTATVGMAGAGAVTLAVGWLLAAATSMSTGVVLPLLLGCIGGLLTQSVLLELRESPDGRLDAADWLRHAVSKGMLVLLLLLYIVPRMVPGAGYVMLGAALVSSAVVVFRGLSQADAHNSVH